MDHIAKYPSIYAQFALLLLIGLVTCIFMETSTLILFFTNIYIAIDTCMDYPLFLKLGIVHCSFTR